MEQDQVVSGQFVTIDEQRWYRIVNSQLMQEFFISPASSGDHWMFVSSQGAISAGRRNPDSALFPYYCADKLLDMASATGPKTIFRIPLAHGGFRIWEPFSRTALNSSSIQRNVYKNELGNKLIFEEIHSELQLAFQYQWSFGSQFGFIRSCRLTNAGQSDRRITLLDGLQNVLPHGLDREFQLRYSNLGDAYKKNELLSDSKLGIYYLSSIPTDRAEPSEGLRATTVWHHGLQGGRVLLSTQQLDRFRNGQGVREERNTRAHRGAYFVSAEIQLDALSHASWQIVADVGLDQTDVANLNRRIVHSPDIETELQDDMAANSNRLLAIVSAADGQQLGNNLLRLNRHQSNVLFNVMRGGLPVGGYTTDPDDLRSHIRNFNVAAYERNQDLLDGITGPVELSVVRKLARETNDADLIRIVLEYLPFTFSRRHGDPTRPWNSFSIDILSADGSPNLSYEGNWRDIFQNWEALALSYPKYVTGMVLRFVNASTADGYNPYRLTKNGFEWESPDPRDPWSNIGYWGDHQIVYLQKLLEWSRRFDPTLLSGLLTTETCTYAEVPYRIRPFDQICNDPHHTIDFDDERSEAIADRVRVMGVDGQLRQGANGQPYHVTLFEKLLVPLLAKITNFVPEGGVWLNTQRPEWNDANNALVGHGLSMVTTCYLRRYVVFMSEWLSADGISATFSISQDVATLLRKLHTILSDNLNALSTPISDQQRHDLVTGFSNAGSDYRQQLYQDGLSESKTECTLDECQQFFKTCQVVFDHTIRSNRRADGLFHSYNLLSLSNGEVKVKRLYEMLEGQVAVLSSGLLTPIECVEVLDALRASRMYREDQSSYMLYPNRELPSFLDKNLIDESVLMSSELIQQLIADGNETIVRVDINGESHFNGDFRNSADLATALDALAGNPAYTKRVGDERAALLEIFEQTFHHSDFTGRSGTFFAYEGLGSIYWHMVSKLALATMENVVAAKSMSGNPSTVRRLHQHYKEIRDGLGLNKSPDHYGAFPFDPYSHTPGHAGVQQPGMTGQVKEDILSRLAEIGVRIDEGRLAFDPVWFESREFLTEDSWMNFHDQNGLKVNLTASAGQFVFTQCQVPIVYERSGEPKLTIHNLDGTTVSRSELRLTLDESNDVFLRNGRITRIQVQFEPSSASGN